MSIFGNESVHLWHKHAIMKLSTIGRGDIMRKRYKNSFISKMLSFVERMPGNVVLRKDVKHLGGSRQVTRGLNALIEDGRLVRIGVGVYAKAEISEFLNEPVLRYGFTAACIETLDRFGVRWQVGQALKAYNEGKTQQVPVRFEVRLRSRFRRRLAYGNLYLRFEGMRYAK